MDLQRGLRGQEHPRARADRHALVQRVAGEHARSGAHEDEVGGAIEIEVTGDAKRRLGVRTGEDRSAAAVLERQIEPGMPADESGNARVSGCIGRVGELAVAWMSWRIGARANR
jgi:hypothetical protein